MKEKETHSNFIDDLSEYEARSILKGLVQAKTTTYSINVNNVSVESIENKDQTYSIISEPKTEYQGSKFQVRELGKPSR